MLRTAIDKAVLVSNIFAHADAFKTFYTDDAKPIAIIKDEFAPAAIKFHLVKRITIWSRDSII